MTKEELAEGIAVFLTHVQHGIHRSVMNMGDLDIKSVDRMEPQYVDGKTVIGVTDGDDLMFFVEVTDA